MSCASGTIAVGEAFRQIREGYADVMISGGAEAPLSPLCFGAFALIRAMSTRNDDPPESRRVPSTATAMASSWAKDLRCSFWRSGRGRSRRGAPIYAEVLGYGLTNDAHHMTAPLPDGSQAARSMSLALDDADMSPQEVEVRQRPRQLDAAQRPDGDARHQERVRRSRVPHACQQHQGMLRPRTRRLGAIEAAICALAIGTAGPADGEPKTPGRDATSITCRAWDAPPISTS